MAEITKSADASLSSVHPPQHCQMQGLTAGAALAAWDNVYVKQSDGKVYKSTGAADNEAATVHGQVPEAYAAGEKRVTIYSAPITVKYSTGLTPGKPLYPSGTVAGGLADAASTGGTVPVAFAVDATRVRFVGPVINY